MSSIKIRAKAKGNTATVKTLVNHIMETGLRKDKKTKKIIPAHYITVITCEHKGKTVVEGLWGRAVSKNPYLSFKFTGAKKGDKIKISWVDNKGGKDSQEATIG